MAKTAKKTTASDAPEAHAFQAEVAKLGATVDEQRRQ